MSGPNLTLSQIRALLFCYYEPEGVQQITRGEADALQAVNLLSPDPELRVTDRGVAYVRSIRMLPLPEPRTVWVTPSPDPGRPATSPDDQ